jgi:hypothetical protein
MTTPRSVNCAKSQKVGATSADAHECGHSKPEGAGEKQMISDTLSDAVAAIDDYLERGYNQDKRDKIIAVKIRMDALRQELDAQIHEQLLRPSTDTKVEDVKEEGLCTACYDNAYQELMGLRERYVDEDGDIDDAFIEALIDHVIDLSGSEQESYSCLMRCVIHSLINHAPDWKGRAYPHTTEAELEAGEQHRAAHPEIIETLRENGAKFGRERGLPDPVSKKEESDANARY